LLDVLRGTFGLRLPVHQRLRETLDGLVSANL
jgi:N-hydroxyarylamine O-acetyltransferase